MTNLAKKFADYQEIYTKGKYLTFKSEKVKVMFHGKFFRFEGVKDVITEEQENNLVEWVASDYLEAVDFKFYHEFDRNLTPDSFTLDVTEDKVITVKTKNLRGFRYAMEAFNLLFEKIEIGVACPIISLSHQVSFNMRGVIEGFYGIPWTHEDRIELLSYLGQNRLNTYMYAPKDDEYQRKLWRELYPEENLTKFTELVEKAEKEMIDFYYMISPGNDIDYTKPEEVKVLTDKLQQMINLGIRNFGLLLDDIDYILKGNAKKKFSSSASAHAFLIAEVDRFLASELADYNLVACPTEYDNHHDSLYLEILNRELPKHIPLFWTGPSTLATQISTKDIEIMSASYERPIVIWDNIPVNDYQKDYELLFLSPYENRSPKLNNKEFDVVGIVSNPMAQWEMSKFTVQNMSKYLWNTSAYKVAQSWTETLTEYAGSEYCEALEIFTSFNPNKYTREVYSLEQLTKIEARDEAYITAELAKLAAASEKLATLPNEAFQKNVGPWLERVKKDIAYWEVVKTGEVAKVKEMKEELSNYPHRIGSDLVAKYVEETGLLK